MDDLLQFLKDNNKNVKDEELQRIADNVRLVGADSDFATLHKVYKWMVNGVPAVDKEGRPTTVNLIDFSFVDNPEAKNTTAHHNRNRQLKMPAGKRSYTR